MNKHQRMLAGRVIYIIAILVSLATFILHALPVKWGIFLSAAGFIVGSMFWPGWDGIEDRRGADE